MYVNYFFTQTWDPKVLVSISILPTVTQNTKYFPDPKRKLPILPNKTSQHMWIVINTSESQNGVKLGFLD